MIGVGIAGAGHFAAHHVRAMAAFADLRLVAVAAGDREAAEAFARQHGGRAVSDWRALLDDPAVDVVIVTTPHHLHAPVAIAAAAAGRHLYVEKPLAPTLDGCVAMHRAAAQGGVQLLAGHLMRFACPITAAADFLATSAIGRPLVGRSGTRKRWMEGNRRPWHLAAESGGGMLLTAGIHALDRLMFLMGADVAAVACASGHLFHDQPVPDVDLALLRFASGALGVLESVGHRDPTMINDTEIDCEDGTLRIDLDRGVQIGQGGAWRALPGSGEPDWAQRALERGWAAMRAAIRDGTPPPVTAAQAGAVIAAIEAARLAAAERREIQVAGWPA
jgi:predicted dehydrogenase